MSRTLTGFVVGFFTITGLPDAATDAIADPHPVTSNTDVTTETIVTTDKPHLRIAVM
jgi:hypothetical protein